MSWRSCFQLLVFAILQFVRGRRGCISFEPEVVEPGKTVTVAVKAQTFFRGTRIINTGDVEGLFIQGVFVGNRPQLPTYKNALSVKACELPGLDIDLDPCRRTMDVTIQITNLSDKPKQWSTTILGYVA